jgi:serine/threonine-protein kinase
MMYSKGELVIIDFERYNIGDPWEEFSDMVWNVMLFKSNHFATGQIHGYFDGEPGRMGEQDAKRPTSPDEEFFKLLALYIANFLLMIWKLHPITTDFGRDVTAKLAQNVLIWFDNMQNPVPTWYLKDF